MTFSFLLKTKELQLKKLIADHSNDNNSSIPLLVALLVTRKYNPYSSHCFGTYMVYYNIFSFKFTVPKYLNVLKLRSISLR